MPERPHGEIQVRFLDESERLEGALGPPVTKRQKEEWETASRDARRFIRLAARIIPKRPPGKAYTDMTVDPENRVMVVTRISDGEVVSMIPLCERETKMGRLCNSPALKHGACINHSTPEELEELGYDKKSIKGKSRLMLALDALVEEETDRIFGVYTDALDANDFTGRPDHAVRIKAANELLDRTQGKATTRAELTGADGDSLTLSHLMAERPDTATDTE